MKENASFMEIVKRISEKAKQAPNREEISGMVKLALDKQAEELKKSGRTGEFIVEDNAPVHNMNSLIIKSSRDEGIKEIQRASDDLYLTALLLKRDPRSLRLYKRFKQTTQVSELAKAMNTSTNSEFIPTNFSAELIDKLNLQLKVAALHPVVVMPTDPYKLPRKTTRSTAILGAEATETSESTIGSGNTTLDAKTLITRIDVSYEMEEDSIVPVLPMIKDDIVFALATAIEDADINGDTTGTHQDSDVTASTDARKAWKGYRKHALSAAKYSFSNGVATDTKMRAIRALMGIYGIDPLQLAWIVGSTQYQKMLTFDDFRTMDKYGANAVVMTGELGKFDGIPVIVSEKIRENLNASGVYDASTTDRTVCLLVRKDGFVHGDRRSVTVEMDTRPEYQKKILVASVRKAFIPRYVETTEKIVGVGYNIALA